MLLKWSARTCSTRLTACRSSECFVRINYLGLIVSFIPLAPTFITKALKRVLEQAIQEAKSRPPQSALQLIALTSNGDLRSAINSLQMLCSQPTHATGKKRKKRDVEDSLSSKKSGQGSRGGKGAKVDIPQDLRAVFVVCHQPAIADSSVLTRLLAENSL